MQNDVSKIDKNFAVETSLSEADIVFHDVRKPPFRCFGLYNYETEPVFRRLPDNIARAANPGVERLALNTAGGRVRFITDSEYVAIKVKMSSVSAMAHMPLTGYAGFDLYVGGRGREEYFRTFVPPFGITDGYESVQHFGSAKMREVTINFPLYNCVDSLYIGLADGAEISPPREYSTALPVVYYGSSITQGGCASRPGNAYPAIISRELDCDHINLGFSGSARAEAPLMEYIASLPMSAFVFDYDFNAPTIEHLRETHESSFEIIRRAQPELPVILVSNPVFDKSPETSVVRRDIIYTTYINAWKRGDRNVYFVDGSSLFMGRLRDACTVDSTHPNDLGFSRMAEMIGKYVDIAIS